MVLRKSPIDLSCPMDFTDFLLLEMVPSGVAKGRITTISGFEDLGPSYFHHLSDCSQECVVIPKHAQQRSVRSILVPALIHNE